MEEKSMAWIMIVQLHIMSYQNECIAEVKKKSNVAQTVNIAQVCLAIAKSLVHEYCAYDC